MSNLSKAVDALTELLDSEDEVIKLEAARTLVSYGYLEEINLSTTPIPGELPKDGWAQTL